MTDDIVTRLREVARNAEPWEVGLLRSSADEIERLRAERDALVEQRDRWIAGTQLHAARANENPPEIRSHRDSADA
jgi:hypothetical protein